MQPDTDKWKTRRWTADDEAQLRRLYAKYERDGALDQLALRINRTQAGIHLKAKRMGLCVPPPPAKPTKAKPAGVPKPWGRARATAPAPAEPGQKMDRTAWVSGWRVVGPHRVYFRSRWEANYARYLQLLVRQGAIASWEHEPKTFWFDAVRRGVCSYKPDFRVTGLDGRIKWHEVKGWLDDRSRVALKRMAKYHPAEQVLVIDAPAYRAIERQHAWQLDGWEPD